MDIICMPLPPTGCIDLMSAPLCWIHARAEATPWLGEAVHALRDVAGLQVQVHEELLPGRGASVARGAATPDAVLVEASHTGNACTWLQALHRETWRCPTLVVTPALDEGSWEKLSQAGADDFVITPLRGEELALRVQRALGWWHSRAPETTQPQCLRGAARPNGTPAGLIGEHASFVAALSQLACVAGTDATVLLLGETGTGKELFAQALHYQSPRATAPFVAVNCGALPPELVESELFGHVKGAYTHAVGSRQGLVQEAAGGTLFLDEIDSLPLAAQAKLLRFLQDKSVRPVGSDRTQGVDVRVVAASNRGLAEMVTRGEFRQDLYFRLNVFGIELPALRQRTSDIPALARHFVRLYAARFGRPVQGLSPAAQRALMQHAWPGNVRELMHLLERAVLMAAGTQIERHDLALSVAPSTTDAASMRGAKQRLVQDFERGYITQLLAEHGGNITHAATAAGKNRRAFFALMRKHGINAHDAG